MAKQDYTVLFQQVLVIFLILTIILLFYSKFIVKDKFQSNTDVERESTDILNYYTNKDFRSESFRTRFLCNVIPSLSFC